MTHIDDKVIELARTAIGFEFGGERFYRHVAELTQNPTGKAMFLRLAAAETEHVAETHVLFAALIGEDEWQRLADQEAAIAQPSKTIAELQAAVAQRGHEVVADDTQALRLAMEMERRAIQVYQEIAEHTTDREMLGLIGKIIQEEGFHYDSLQAQLDSVQNVGLWLDTPEFRMDAKY
ncbi:MAG: hypothetical protein COS39_01405 [Hydrogenophilales bacterium CG03_land_8_20_14_0_80_62_28]|nr:MAG: hypothetical protein COS39_01405 [Hydrogenophilales bacterium CG03_land_8_20_14_0_80_62_28]